MKQSVLLTLHGRVQGVGFRYFVKQKAEILLISGFVKNNPTGTVYIEAEGEEENIQLFIAMCKQGPSHAWVEKADVQYCPIQGFNGFEKR